MNTPSIGAQAYALRVSTQQSWGEIAQTLQYRPDEDKRARYVKLLMATKMWAQRNERPWPPRDV